MKVGTNVHVPNLLKSNLADLWIWTLANQVANNGTIRLARGTVWEGFLRPV